MLVKKSTQGENHYKDPQIEKHRYNPYRKANRQLAEDCYNSRSRGIPFDLPFPLHVIIETSSLCNLKCSFCNREVMTRPQQNMTLETFKKVVDECAENRVYSLSLYALGEPMLNKDIGKMIVYAKNMGIPYVDLSTNGMIPFKNLLGTGLNELIVSVDGDKKTHEKLRKGADYKKITDNIDDFIIAKKTYRYRQPFLRMQIIDIPETHDLIDGYINKWKNKADVIYIKGLEVMAQNLGDKNLTQSEIDERLKNRVPCKQLFFVMTVNSDGSPAYCCHDSKGLSVLRNMTIKQAWEKVKEIRDNHVARNYTDLCKNCVDWRW